MRARCTKHCPNCEQDKPLDCFNNDRRSSDGKNWQCKKCDSERCQKYYQKHKKQIIAHQKKSYKKNKKQCNKRTSEYAKHHREEGRARNRFYYHRDIEKSRAQALAKKRNRTPAQKIHQVAYTRQYNKAHQTKRNDYSARRRAVKLASFVEAVNREEIHCRDSGKCCYCGKSVCLEKMHVDHVIPLVKGGEHSYANCVCACPSCNLQKSSKLPEEFHIESA